AVIQPIRITRIERRTFPRQFKRFDLRCWITQLLPVSSNLGALQDVYYNKIARTTAYKMPAAIAPAATFATSTLKATILTNAIAASTILGTPTMAARAMSIDTTRITPTTAALTPERNA